MHEICCPIELGFSIVDADYPRFELLEGTLTVSYTDWQEKKVCVLFNDVMAMKWQEAEFMEDGDGIEGAYVVEGSSWLAEYAQKRHQNLEIKHFRFDFNHIGSLEVICHDFQHKNA